MASSSDKSPGVYFDTMGKYTQLVWVVKFPDVSGKPSEYFVTVTSMALLCFSSSHRFLTTAMFQFMVLLHDRSKCRSIDTRSMLLFSTFNLGIISSCQSSSVMALKKQKLFSLNRRFPFTTLTFRHSSHAVSWFHGLMHYHLLDF